MKENVNEVKKENKIKSYWTKKKKSQKIGFIILTIILVLTIIFANLLAFCRHLPWMFSTEFCNSLLGDLNDKNVISYDNGYQLLGKILSDQLNKIVLSLIAISIAIILVFLVNLIMNFIIKNSGKKGTTISSLIRSALKYLIILIDIAFILGIWGVNVASIVAGLGVLTLIIGLGCQSLIADIVSGLFIVIDDYFSVGDMVIIDGFRGNVVAIGLRTVKLDDGCGNMKSITNSSINTVVNLSRSLNLISITMSVSYNEDLNRVEAIIAKELPKINLPQIEGGISYKGVSSIDDSSIELGFSARCKCQYRFQVKRDLNREIYRMFIDNDILIPYNQIVINKEDPAKPKATNEDILLAKKLNDNNRQVKEDVDKSLIIKTKNAIIDSIDNKNKE